VLSNNPAVLLDLNEDIFFETTPMEHLQLLLRFMNYPGDEANIISQADGDFPALSINRTNRSSGGSVSNFRRVGEEQNNPNSLVASTRTLSSVLPLLSQISAIDPPPGYIFPRPNIFRRGHSNDYGIRDGFFLSTSNNFVHELVRDEVKVKSESTVSRIIASPEDWGRRFLHSPMDIAHIKTEPYVFTTFHGSFDHKRKQNIAEKNTPIIGVPKPITHRTNPRVKNKVRKVCKGTVKVGQRPTCMYNKDRSDI